MTGIGLVLAIAGCERLRAPAPSDPRHSALQGVAVNLTRTGFRLCPRQWLSGCEIRFGLPSGRDLRWTNVHAPARVDCDAQQRQALDACAREISLGQREAADCMQQQGYPQVFAATRSDPRDEHLPPGEFRLQCNQGRLQGTFRADAFDEYAELEIPVPTRAAEQRRLRVLWMETENTGAGMGGPNATTATLAGPDDTILVLTSAQCSQPLLNAYLSQARANMLERGFTEVRCVTPNGPTIHARLTPDAP